MCAPNLNLVRVDHAVAWAGRRWLHGYQRPLRTSLSSCGNAQRQKCVRELLWGSVDKAKRVRTRIRTLSFTTNCYFALAWRRPAELSATFVSNFIEAIMESTCRRSTRKSRKLRPEQLAAVGDFHFQRIDLHVVDPDLVMQMRARRHTGLAAIGDRPGPGEHASLCAGPARSARDGRKPSHSCCRD